MKIKRDGAIILKIKKKQRELKEKQNGLGRERK